MKPPRKTYTGQQTQRRDRLIRERVHDPYKTRLKLPEPTICPQCKAIWHKGRWKWAKEKPEGANQALCQACHRTNDHYPAGEVTISGNFVNSHKDEILHVIRNTENLEKEEHPLHRIMAVDDQKDRILVTTTDIHLPRRIGQAIHNSFAGDLNFHYDEEGYFIRVSWARGD